jgi:phospholipid/cholesterol/gamma-HCH transport system substrate-binding protein
MDQSESNKDSSKDKNLIKIPKRTFSLEFVVGVFALLSFLATGYLAVGLGGLEFGNAGKYLVKAQFDNISGLKNGASVEIAGVKIGEVSNIELSDPYAIVTLKIENEVPLKDDDILSIRTKGIIGDRYIKISRGGSDDLVKPNSTITETESVVDLEDIIGKLVHSFTNDKDKEDEKE